MRNKKLLYLRPALSDYFQLGVHVIKISKKIIIYSKIAQKFFLSILKSRFRQNIIFLRVFKSAILNRNLEIAK